MCCPQYDECRGISRGGTRCFSSSSVPGAMFTLRLDALEECGEQGRLLAIPSNLQSPSVHGLLHGPPSKDEQEIVPRGAAERHVGLSVRHGLAPKTVLADQHVLLDRGRSRHVETIPERRAELRDRAKGNGQPAQRYAEQRWQGGFR